MTKAEWIERNRDGLEQAYSDLYLLCIREDGVGRQDTPNWRALKQYEDALVALGILEGDEPMDDAEDTNEAFNWDEWMLDYKIDMMREERMAYEV